MRACIFLLLCHWTLFRVIAAASEAKEECLPAWTMCNKVPRFLGLCCPGLICAQWNSTLQNPEGDWFCQPMESKIEQKHNCTIYLDSLEVVVRGTNCTSGSIKLGKDGKSIKISSGDDNEERPAGERRAANGVAQSRGWAPILVAVGSLFVLNMANNFVL